VEKNWHDFAPHLLAPDSAVAILGGLYGGGLKIMLRNLHHNPQVDTVILMGKDFSGIVEHVINFFADRTVLSEKKENYVFPDGQTVPLAKLTILGDQTCYTLDSLIGPQSFSLPPQILDWTKEPGNISPHKLASFLETYAPRNETPADRPAAIILPKLQTATFPSEAGGQAVVSATILDGWGELLFRLSRFGETVILRNGKERKELRNVKVVVKNPGQYTREDILKNNLARDKIKEYQRDLLNPHLPPGGSSYTYGHRLGEYFGINLLNQAARDLAADLDSRHGYITLWDNTKDPVGHDTPCLVSLFFRKIETTVHMTATFRSHNGSRAWPVNCFGLYGVMEQVCQMANDDPQKTQPGLLVPGELTVISQSISLDPQDLPQVGEILDNYLTKSSPLVPDPHGYFKLGIDQTAKEIIAWHFDHKTDELIAEYRSPNPTQMARELTKYLAVSDPGHALYLGSQLERAWYCLVNNLEYVQDKTKIVREP
jgi:thymidylate synthase